MGDFVTTCSAYVRIGCWRVTHAEEVERCSSANIFNRQRYRLSDTAQSPVQSGWEHQPWFENALISLRPLALATETPKTLRDICYPAADYESEKRRDHRESLRDALLPYTTPTVCLAIIALSYGGLYSIRTFGCCVEPGRQWQPRSLAYKEQLTRETVGKCHPSVWCKKKVGFEDEKPPRLRSSMYSKGKARLIVV
jgi:hypothetical protein